MTAPKSATQYMEEVTPLLGSVPAAALDFVCKCCLGATDTVEAADKPPRWFETCYPCRKLCETAPPHLHRRFIAATTALNPGPWYSRLDSYKRSAPQHMPLIASVTWKFLHEHKDRFDALLGGAADHLVIVPSTRGYPYNEQPLWKALSRAAPLRDLLAPVVRHAGQGRPPRQEYTPTAFEVDGDAVRGKRLIVIDDTWVSGRNLISVAGALLEGGAAEVVPFAVARVVRASFRSPEHPYRIAMARPFELTSWPR